MSALPCGWKPPEWSMLLMREPGGEWWEVAGLRDTTPEERASLVTDLADDAEPGTEFGWRYGECMTRCDDDCESGHLHCYWLHQPSHKRGWHSAEVCPAAVIRPAETVTTTL